MRRDPARAERLLDELIAFLRAALPRLRDALVEPSRARPSWRAPGAAACAGRRDPSVGMTIDVADDAMDARFPPGVLLPLLNDALRGPRRHVRADRHAVAATTAGSC